MQLFEMRGNGLVLSAITEDDVPRIAAYCQDPEVQRWTTVPVPYTTRNAELFVRELVPAGWEKGSELTWGVRIEGDPLLRGTAGVRTCDPGSVEIAYLVTADARGQGVAERACRLILHYALAPDGLGADRVVWRAAAGNWASWRVAWKLGFRREGEIRADIVIRGRRLDGWIGTLLPGDPQIPATPWDGPEAW